MCSSDLNMPLHAAIEALCNAHPASRLDLGGLLNADRAKPGNANVEEEKSSGLKQFVGKWVLKTNDNSDAYLTARGVGMIKRNVFKAVNCTMTVEHDEKEENKCTVKVDATGGKSGTWNYEMDKAIECKGIQGKDQSRLPKLADGNLVVTTTCTEGVKDNAKMTPETRAWKIEGGKLVVTVSSKPS